MAWFILSGISTATQLYESGDAPNPFSTVDSCKVKLDAIEKSLVGSLKIERVKESIRKIKMLKFATTALEFIDNPQFIADLVKKHKESKLYQSPTTRERLRRERTGAENCDTPIRMTADKWKDHLHTLEECGILQSDVDMECIKAVATYFAVLKTEDTARAIYNGTEVNKFLGPAPPLNTPTAQEILDKISRLNRSQRKSIFTADIRHWFHQIPLSVQVSLYFCLVYKNNGTHEWRRWATLPMGTSWSPYIAQCLAWVLMIDTCSNMGGWPFTISPDEALAQPPKWVHLKGGGFLTIYIDNIIAVGNQGILEELNHKLIEEQFLFQEFGVTLKEASLLNADQWSRTAVRLLGVELQRRNNPETCANKRVKVRYTATWRPIGDKVERWREPWEQIKANEANTFRTVAKLCGRLLWIQSLTLKPLCSHHRVIAVLRRLAKQRVADDKKWDDPFPLFEEEIKELQLHVDRMFTNEWMNGIVRNDESFRIEEVFGCSDASESGWGFLLYDGQDVTTCTVHRGLYTRNEHIFVKEFWVAKRMIMHMVNTKRETSDAHIRVIAGIDNSAAAQVIRNMYTSNTFIQQDVEELNDFLLKMDASVFVVNVRSEDNVADQPSRGDPVCPVRFCVSQKALKDGLEGLRANEYNLDDAPRGGGPRHSGFMLADKRKRGIEGGVDPDLQEDEDEESDDSLLNLMFDQEE